MSKKLFNKQATLSTRALLMAKGRFVFARHPSLIWVLARGALISFRPRSIL